MSSACIVNIYYYLFFAWYNGLCDVLTGDTMPNCANKDHYMPLENVVTLAGACRMTGRSRSAIRYAIDAGNIAAVRDGRIWLIYKPSLLAWFP